MAKRGNNEGSIYKDKQGRWRGVVTIYTVEGKQKKKYFYGKTKREVTDKVNQVLNELRLNTYIEPSGMTLIEWLNTWIDAYCRNEVRESTLVNYEIFAEKHIAPTIGNIRLCNLNPVILQRFYNDKQHNGRLRGSGGLSPKTIKNIHDMLHRALEQAVKLDMILKNPADSVTLPKIIKKERRYLTVEEQHLLQKQLKDDAIGTAILLDLYTGMRQGELLGLMWKNVHLDCDAPYLRVTQTLNRLKNYGEFKDRKTVLEIGYPKTPHSVRNIPLLPNIAEKLRIYKGMQEKYMHEHGIIPNGYVFTSSTGNWIDPKNFQRDFKLTLKRCGIREINVHGIRHTFATRALESGMSVKTLSKILGHANVGFTLDTYAHVTDDLMNEEIANLQGFLEE